MQYSFSDDEMCACECLAGCKTKGNVFARGKEGKRGRKRVMQENDRNDGT